MKILELRLKIVVVVFALYSEVVFSQTKSDSTIFITECLTTPREFDNWVELNYKAAHKRQKIDLDSIKSRVLNRLSIGMFVSENTIHKAIKLQSLIDFEKKIKVVKYDDTIMFIDSLLLKSTDRPDLEIYLLSQKGFFLTNSGDTNNSKLREAILVYSKITRMADSIKMELDLDYLSSNLKMGRLLRSQSQTGDDVEKYFMKVMQYQFYLIDDTDYFCKIRELYVQAGRERIQMNRGNLKRLKNIYFFPSTYEELNPLLRYYIEEVGGVWDRNFPVTDDDLKIRNH